MDARERLLGYLVTEVSAFRRVLREADLEKVRAAAWNVATRAQTLNWKHVELGKADYKTARAAHSDRDVVLGFTLVRHQTEPQATIVVGQRTSAMAFPLGSPLGTAFLWAPFASLTLDPLHRDPSTEAAYKARFDGELVSTTVDAVLGFFENLRYKGWS